MKAPRYNRDYEERCHEDEPRWLDAQLEHRVDAQVNATPDRTADKGCSVEGIVGQIRPHDWTEDFSHENGNYECRCHKCGSIFTGHKRMVLCKVCFNATADRMEPQATFSQADGCNNSNKGEE